jgi:hypothetical protein
MGLFWDLYQQSQITKAAEKSGALESRVVSLEHELQRTQELLRQVISRLEQHVGKDLDADGRIG